jgi:fructose/tagatose bisphosphate aldolase
MPLPTATEYAALIDAASADGYAIPAVNVTSTLTLNAALRGFAEARSPGIVQVTVGGAGYVPGAAADALVGARRAAAVQHAHVRRLDTPARGQPRAGERAARDLPKRGRPARDRA